MRKGYERFICYISKRNCNSCDIFCGCFDNYFINTFIRNFKLRYTEKLKIASELSKRKYKGITQIRKEIHILFQYEDLCVTEDEKSLIPENIGKKVYTPASCYTYKTLVEISRTLNDLYGEFGCCLRHTSVIYLVYIKNFL